MSATQNAIQQQRRAVIDSIDAITEKSTAAAAIVDAAAILAALARVPFDEQRQVGEGCAGGYELHDDTLPNLLKHAGSLIREIDAIAQSINHNQVKVAA